MRDSSLIFLEKPLERDSLALIAHTTTVLQMTEHGGNLNATLEIQVRMTIDTPLVISFSLRECRSHGVQ